MKVHTRRLRPFAAKMGDPGATSAVRHQGEARIAQERAMLSQKPGTATATGGGTATAVSSLSPPYQCHCPDWYEGEDCDHDD